MAVFLGPRERFHDKIPDHVLEPRRSSAPRFFFLAYELPVPLRSMAHAGQRDIAFGGMDVGDDAQADCRICSAGQSGS